MNKSYNQGVRDALAELSRIATIGHTHAEYLPVVAASAFQAIVKAEAIRMLANSVATPGAGPFDLRLLDVSPDVQALTPPCRYHLLRLSEYIDGRLVKMEAAGFLAKSEPENQEQYEAGFQKACRMVGWRSSMLALGNYNAAHIWIQDNIANLRQDRETSRTSTAFADSQRVRKLPTPTPL